MTVPANVKTFLPKLLLIARTLCNYIRRYDATIRKYIGEGNEATLDAVLVACDALEIAIEAVLPSAG